MKGSDAEFDNQLKIKFKQKWLTIYHRITSTQRTPRQTLNTKMQS